MRVERPHPFLLEKKVSKKKIVKIIAMYRFDNQWGEYSVGNKGVTKITQVEHSPEPFCAIYEYQVWMGEELFCVLSERLVNEVYFDQRITQG